MSILSQEQMKRIEERTMFRMEEEERSKMKQELETLLTYIETLDSLDTGGLEPRISLFEENLRLREDEIVQEEGIR